MARVKDRFKGNPNLPVAGAEFDYGPYQVKEMKKCQQNILHFAEHYFYIINLDEGRIKLPLRPYQKRVLRSMRDNRFFIMLSGRQIGKSVLLTVYALWQGCFNSDQKIVLIANKEATAIEIFKKIRIAYEQLPNWLKPGVMEWSKTSMTLANGTEICVSTTTGSAVRGTSINCVTGDTMVTVRCKKTNVARVIPIRELVSADTEILGPYGFQNFEGVRKSKQECVKITFNNGNELKCTYDHRLLDTLGQDKYVRDLNIGDTLLNINGDQTVKNIEPFGVQEVFDPINCDSSYYATLDGSINHNCLLLDELAFVECLDSSAQIKLLNTQSNNVTETTIGEAYEFLNHSNSQWQIDTPDGWKDFHSIAKYAPRQLYRVTCENGLSVEVSENHCFIGKNNKEIFAHKSRGKLIQTTNGLTRVKSIIKTKIAHVYDVKDVADSHVFYANNIVHHNTHLLDEFWRSVYPTITSSKTAKILITSTPNGTGNLYHKIWHGAINKENNFYPEEVKYEEIPGRDAKFREDAIKELGSFESFQQEYLNIFLQHGDGAIDAVLFDKYQQDCTDPIQALDDGAYKMWAYPDPSRIYVAGIDTSEGVGHNASVIQILDITDLQNIEQVATYWNKHISPYEFTGKVHEILKHWGSPLACIERNNQGAQVIDTLVMRLNYENVVSWGSSLAGRSKAQLGMISHSNTKNKAITNMRYFVSNLKVMKFHDLGTIKELRDLVRHDNGTWSAREGCDDDRVFGLIWALAILMNDLCSEYFEYEPDDNGRPRVLTKQDWSTKYFTQPDSLYNGMVQEYGEGSGVTAPVVFGMENNINDEMAELYEQGWMNLEGFVQSSRQEIWIPGHF